MRRDNGKFELVGQLMTAMLSPTARLQIYNPLRASESDIPCDFHAGLKGRAVEGRMTANREVFYICRRCLRRVDKGAADSY